MSASATRRALRLGRPIWIRNSRPVRRYPSLRGRHETAVAIVGGGMTGALVTQAFAAAGVPTLLIEASSIGRASTAASSALLLQEPDLELRQLTENYGAPASRRIWRLCRESVRDLIRLLERLNVRCDLQARDAIYYATDAAAAARLRRELDHRSRSGFKAEWLGAGAVRHLTGLAAFGAIRTRGNAQLDPYRACAGIVRAAVAAGAEVYERSEVQRIDADRHRVCIRTRHGTVEAERVVIATGYATPWLRPLAGRFRMYRTYVLATPPLTRTQRAEIGLSDVMIWNTSRPYHYARWTADHRLLLGGGDRLLGPGPGRERQFDSATRAVRSYFERLLPGLAAIPTQSGWEGLFALTADSLPYIGSHRRYRRHWFALGYGGNGLTFGALAARLLLERWQDETSSDHALFGFQRMR